MQFADVATDRRSARTAHGLGDPGQPHLDEHQASRGPHKKCRHRPPDAGRGAGSWLETPRRERCGHTGTQVGERGLRPERAERPGLHEHVAQRRDLDGPGEHGETGAIDRERRTRAPPRCARACRRVPRGRGRRPRTTPVRSRSGATGQRRFGGTGCRDHLVFAVDTRVHVYEGAHAVEAQDGKALLDEACPDHRPSPSPTAASPAHR